MSKYLTLSNITPELRNDIFGLVERSLKTDDDVGLVIEYEKPEYIEPATRLKRVAHAKTIFRSNKITLECFYEGQSVKTTVAEVQAVKGVKKEAGKITKFFVIEKTVGDFQKDFPGYDLYDVFGRMSLAENEPGIVLGGRYTKDSQLHGYLLKNLSCIYRTLFGDKVSDTLIPYVLDDGRIVLQAGV